MNYIPVIDLAGIADNESSLTDIKCNEGHISISDKDYPHWHRISGEIRTALNGIGFVYLSNHGIPEDLISDAFEASKIFFNLPETIKEKYKKNAKVSSHGWVQPGQELLHPNSIYELRECFDIAGNKRFYPTPDQHANFRDVMEKLENEGKKLMRKLLKVLGLSLELEDTDYFIKSSRHLDSDSNDPQNTITNECDLRAIYYPAIPDNLQVPPGTVRCAEHTDYEILTLLFQDHVGGWFGGQRCEWEMDPCCTDTKYDFGQYWRSAPVLDQWILSSYGNAWFNLHRVVIPEKEIEKRVSRYSFAYFFAPDDDTLISPLKSRYVPASVMGEKNRKEGEKTEITAYEHIMNRVKNAYQY